MKEDPKVGAQKSPVLKGACKTGRRRETGVSVKEAPESHATRQDSKETPGGGCKIP